MVIAATGEKIPASWWKEKVKMDGFGINQIRLSRNFTLDEFESPDTNEVVVSATLVRLLQRLRDTLRCPILITSGYRTPEHNIQVGGAGNSYHKKGMAVDIIVYRNPKYYADSTYPSETDRRYVAIKALAVGFSTAIIYTKPGHQKSHVHLDIRKPGLGFVEM